MISLIDRSPVLCDGLPRRTVLRAGGAGALAWVLGDGLGRASGGANANAAPVDVPSQRVRAKNCIVLFLMGGPPQHSLWDPKPHAADNIRGPFRPISTSVPGLQIGELLPKTAELAHHLALLRAVSTGDNAHSSSGYAMLTGVPHQPLNFENANPGAPNDWPTLAAVVQHLHANPGVLPASVRLPHHIFNTDRSVWPGQDAGWLGAAANPWLFRCEPGSPTFQVSDFELAGNLPVARLELRRHLLHQLDSQLAHLERSQVLDTFDGQQRQAFELLSDAKCKQAFQLDRESDQTRDRYGRGQFGQSVLLARRLVESGVSFVHVNWFRGADEPDAAPCWDSHVNEADRLKRVLVPPFDQAYSALLQDLVDRGMLDDTLVVCMAEFGRSPKINGQGGRDHWGHVFSIAMAGGGIRGGVVHGSSDAIGGFPQNGLVRPSDIAATIFHCLGYHPETEIRDRLNRPLAISRGNPIREVLA